MVDLRDDPISIETQGTPVKGDTGARCLQGLSFVVKDSFQVAGYPTSNGNPTWRSTPPLVAPSTSPVVTTLLNAGAKLIGKTVMDEMAYDLSGENVHYGSPVNPACGGASDSSRNDSVYRTCGGSSSGSAGAVAAGIADFSIGGDTGGSVRVPASFCGLYGMRPSHGSIPTTDSCPLAPSFDTVGWFSQSAELLRLVGTVLLHSNDTPMGSTEPLKNLLLVREAFELAETSARKALEDVAERRLSAKLRGSHLRVQEVRLNDFIGRRCDFAQEIKFPDAWVTTFRTHQAYEVWLEHGAWIKSATPKMGDAVLKRFEAAARVTRSEFENAAECRNKVRSVVRQLLSSDGVEDTVLVFPTAPGSAPILRRQAVGDVSGNDDFRMRVLSLTCISGLTGFPEISMPLATNDDGCPLGLSLLGPKGSDERLLALACHISDLLSVKT